MPKRLNRDHLAPDDYFTLASVARDMGITSKSLKASMHRRRMKLKRAGNLWLVSIHQLERFIEDTEQDAPRVPYRPQGWYTTQQAAAKVGTSQELIWSKRSELRVVRYKKRLYWHSDDIQALHNKFNQRAPIGWYEGASFAMAHGAHRTTLNKWLENHDVETRLYRNNNNKLTIHLRATTLCEWLRAYQYSHKINRMNHCSVSAYEQVRRLLATANQPMTQTSILPLLENVSKKQLSWTLSKLVKRRDIIRFKRDGVMVYSSNQRQKAA